MKIYIDTNIFLDAILNRDNGISRSILLYLGELDIETILNNISIINIHYFISKDKSLNTNDIKKHIDILLSEYTVISADKSIIKQALYSDFKDFEDAIQYFCAKNLNADLIITNDKKGFLNSDIQVINATNFYNKYIKQNY